MPYIGNKYEIGDHNNSWKTLDDISSYVATFDGSATNAVSTTNNTIRVPEHRFIQGQRVTYSNGGGGNIGGLTNGTAYYIIHDTNNEFKLATSLVNANASTAINLSAVGTGTSHTVTAAFDGVNKKFKITYSGGKSSRFTSATQLSVAINNILQRPNDTTTFTDGFRISDNEKIEFNVAPVAADIFWGSILSASLPTFDVSDNKLDNFTGDGSTTDFTLSHIPANNESIIVTVNGVLQHPTDKNGTRAYSLDASVLVFTAAPANGDEIQVRHIGFAGASSSAVTGFYGRTGNVTLSSSADNAIVGVITATKFSGAFDGTITSGNNIVAGIITATKIDLNGDIDVDGHTTLDNVSVGGATTISDNLKVTANIEVGLDLDVDGHTNLDNVSVAGVSTFSEDVKFIGATSGRDLLWDKSLNILNFKDNTSAKFGNDYDLSIYHNNSIGIIANSTGALSLLSDTIVLNNEANNAPQIQAITGASGYVKLFQNGNEKLATTSTGVNITGICAATDFSGAAGGAADFPNGLTGTTATFSGNVSIGGTLTYEDVTNIDAVGLVTARDGIFLPDSKLIKLGNTAASPHFTIEHNGTNGVVDTNTGDLILRSDADDVKILAEDDIVLRDNDDSTNFIHCINGASVKLYNAGNERLETTNQGTKISGGADTVLLVQGTSTASRIDLKTSSHHRFWQTLESDGRFRFYDQTNAAERFSITSTGLISIGNESNLDSQLTITQAQGDCIRLRSVVTNNTFKYGIIKQEPYNNNAVGLHIIAGKSDSGYNEIAIGGGVDSGYAATQIDFYTGATTTTATGTRRLRIESDGDLLLQGGKIYGDDAATGTFTLQNTSGNANHARIEIGAIQSSDNGGIHFYTAGASAATRYMTLKGGGNLGIGVDNPLTQLHLESSDPAIRIQRAGQSAYGDITADTAGKITFKSDPGGAASGDGFSFTVDNSEKVRINSDGQLIAGATLTGTEGGNAKLCIVGTGAVGANPSSIAASTVATFRMTGATGHAAGISIISGNTASTALNFGDSDNELIGRILYNHTSGNATDYMAFYVQGSEKVRIDSSGSATFNGEIATAQDYPNYRPTLDFNFVAVKKLDPRITYERTGPASYTDEFGIVKLVGDNTPRFDHDLATRESKGLLIEEGRTNLIYPSSDWSVGNPGWTINNAGSLSVETHTGDTKDPAGTYTASKLVTLASNTNTKDIWWTASNITYTDTVKFAVSCFAKSTTGLHLQLRPRGQGSNKAWATYNLSTGAVGASGGTTLVSTKIEKYPNGWYRCSLVFTGSGNSSCSLGTLIMDDGNDAEAVSHTGDASKSIYLWGAQIEQSNIATSYIPTSTAATTRGSDKVMIQNDEFYDFYNPLESTICASFTHFDTITAANLGTNARAYRFRHDGGTDSRIDYVSHTTYHPYIAADGTAVTGGTGLDAGTLLYEGQVNKTAVKVKENDFGSCINGGSVAVDTSGDWNPTNALDEVSLGSSNGAANTLLMGHMQRFTYYPVGLTNSQLKTLTS